MRNFFRLNFRFAHLPISLNVQLKFWFWRFSSSAIIGNFCSRVKHCRRFFSMFFFLHYNYSTGLSLLRMACPFSVRDLITNWKMCGSLFAVREVGFLETLCTLSRGMTVHRLSAIHSCSIPVISFRCLRNLYAVHVYFLSSARVVEC